MDIKIEGNPTLIDDKEDIEFIYNSIFKNLRRLKRGKDFRPSLIIAAKDKKIAIPVIFRNEGEKTAWKMMVNAYCRMVQALYVIFIKDCFLKHYQGEDVEAYLNSPGFVMPRNDPKRVEAIMVMVVRPDLEQNILIIKYYRKGNDIEFDREIKWQTDTGKAYINGIIQPWKGD